MGILKKVEKGKLDPRTAYDCLYGRRSRRARFLFIRIWIAEEFFVSLLLNTLFFLPVPLAFVRPFLKFIPQAVNPRGIYHDLRRSGGGLKLRVKTSAVHIFLKLF
jgi:hypothetical protein